MYRCFNYLIDPSFQVVNRLFVLLFENSTDREVHTKYYIPKVEIKDYNAIIDGINVLDQPLKNDLKTYDTLERSQLVKEIITHLVFISLSLFQETLQANCNRFK